MYQNGGYDEPLQMRLARSPQRSLHRPDLFPHTPAYDLFPCTVDIQAIVSFHVETVALLSQQQPDDIIEIDLNLDELDITTAELDVTYPKIKEYVLKKYGFKVSSLYIAQIKRKWGLKTRKNFNLSQKEKPVVPQCPSQKEEAITDALKYFGFI